MLLALAKIPENIIANLVKDDEITVFERGEVTDWRHFKLFAIVLAVSVDVANGASERQLRRAEYLCRREVPLEVLLLELVHLLLRFVRSQTAAIGTLAGQDELREKRPGSGLRDPEEREQVAHAIQEELERLRGRH